MTGNEADAVLEAIRCAPAVRSFALRPVSRELVVRLLTAATAAPSPRNLQPWEFVAVMGPEARERLGEAFAPRAQELEAAVATMDEGPTRRMFVAGARLARSMRTAPLIVMVCGRHIDMPPPHDPDEVLLSALFTAAQNLRIAARAMGLGSAFTNLHVHAEREVRQVLGIPDDARVAATIPIGWPAHDQGPVRRRPLDEVVHWDRWSPRS